MVEGDRRIIIDKKLQALFAEGSTYQEPRKIDFEQELENTINGIEDCIYNMESKHGISNAVWLEWKSKMIKLVNARINTLTTLKVSFNHST